MLSRLLCFELIKYINTHPNIFLLLYLYSKKYNVTIIKNKLKAVIMEKK